MRVLKTKKTVLFTILALTLCMGVFCVPALASDGGGETLTVTAVWVDGDLLRINVTDADGASSALALNLADYVSDAGNQEYISIQAVDLAGNSSGVIEIKNPYYVPPTEPVTPPTAPADPPQSSESAIPDGGNPAGDGRPFTPDGTGTVMDNATDGDGKEFFTIGTEDGDVFYLIVDRQRNADNVYLLNAVTEDDLMALAEKNGREITPGDHGVSAIPEPEQPGTSENPPPTVTPEPEPEAPAKKSDTSMYILIGIAVIGVGGAGYYFKIVKGRNNAADDDVDEDEYGYDDPDDDDDYSDEDEGGDEE